jgi:hypothetical protein
MAKVTIEFEGEQKGIDDAILAFIKAHKWENFLENNENILDTSAQRLDFAKNILGNFIRESIKAYNAKVAASQARKSALTASDDELDKMSSKVSLS